MHYVFIVGDYYGIASANGICVKAIVNELASRDNKVEVICNGIEYAHNNVLDKHSVIIHTVNYMKKGANVFKRTVYKIKEAVSIVNYPIRSQKQVEQYTELLKKINVELPIDVVVACQRPYAATKAGVSFRSYFPQSKLLVYELDSLGNDLDLNLGWMKLFKTRCRRLEIRYYRIADLILHLECNRLLYDSRVYSAFQNKSVFVDIPLLDESNYKDIIDKDEESTTKKKEIQLLYSGVLVEKIREPDYIINLVKKLSESMQCTLTFYSRGTCEGTIEKESRAHSCIKSKGYVPREIVDKEMMKADYLVSIGNSFTQINNALPSKIFVYMSTGKPIIHVLSGEHDACKKYLEKYPGALLLDPTECIEKNIMLLKQFDTENRGKITPFDEIYGIFYKNTPKYTADIIESIILRNADEYR